MSNKGIALVITLLVLTLLMVIILEFNLGMRVEARAAANFRDDMKAYYLARSGVTFATALLEEDAKTDPKNVDSLNELWAQKIPPIPLGDGFVSIEITDEQGKFSVNKLDSGFMPVNGPIMRSWMVRLLEEFELKGELAYTIADWIDKNDDEELPDGAESRYYEGLEEPYQTKNKPLDSLQELRLIKGMDDDTFTRLKNFLTVYADGPVNINTASKEVLLSLSDDMSEGIADEIIARRIENRFDTVQDVSKETFIRESLYGEISKFINVRSNYFSITSTGEVNQIKKTINAMVKRENDKTKIIYWRVE